MRRFVKPACLLSGFHAPEPDKSVPELIHAGEKWVSTDTLVPWRRHKKWEFYYQVDGTSFWRSCEHRYQVEAGDLLVTPPGITHARIDPSPSRHHFFYAQIDLDKVLKRIPQIGKIFDARAMIHQGNAEALLIPFRQLVREVAFNQPHRTQGLRLAVDCLVVEIARVLANIPGNTFLSGHPSVHRARELMDHKPREHWSVPEIARLVGLSTSRLNELFREEFGMSPHQYLLRLRVDLAAQALGQTHQPITDIALDLGFSSSQHFAQAFRKHFGVNARNYRSQKLNARVHV
jgi:AraC-like DNA-binding protein